MSVGMCRGKGKVGCTCLARLQPKIESSEGFLGAPFVRVGLREPEGQRAEPWFEPGPATLCQGCSPPALHQGLEA